jgi:cytochrome c-type biogenesis protein CcmE
VKKAYLIALMVIGAAMGFTLWAFSSAMTPYVDIRTARASSSPVQVKGKIVHAKQYWDPTNNVLRFPIVDQNNDTIEIVYTGAKPDAFDTAPETAATGIVQKDAAGHEVFVSSNMVVKCPSKYDDRGKAPGAELAGGKRS